MDQVRDKNAPVISINEAIKTSFNYNLKSSPSSGIMETIKNLKMSEQPPTDCKISFSQFHPATNTLCVKLQPHFLIINQTDLPIITKISETGSSWLIEPASVFHPPSLANTKFYFGQYGEGGAERWGGPLELADSDWTYLSIRPAVQGVLHRTGALAYRMLSHRNLYSFVTLTSEVSDGIRVVFIKPAFVIHNQSGLQLYLKSCVAPEKGNRPEPVMSGEVKSYMTVTEAITPVSFWTSAGGEEGGQGGHLHHSLSCSLDHEHWSLDWDIPLDLDSRKCVTVPDPASDILTNIPLVLMTQRADNQTFIVIKTDTRPQVRLNNLLSVGIIFKEEGSKTFEQLEASRSLYVTMPWLSRGFPYIDQVKESRRLQFSLENNAWSAGVDLTATQETFISLPGHGDVRVTVEWLQPTTHVYVEPVSHLEVAARDIRARFESPPVSPVSTVYATPDTSQLTALSPGTDTEDQYLDCHLDTEHQFRTSSRRPSTSSSFSIISKPARGNPGHFINIKCRELSFAISDDLCFEDDFQEILRMTFSNVEVKGRPRTDFSTVFKTLGGEHPVEFDVEVEVGDCQVDNQMFKRGLYHFPVLLSGQHLKDQKSLPLIKVNMIFTVSDGSFYSRDFHLKCEPMSLNVEDTLFYKLQEYLNIFLMPVNDGVGTLKPESAALTIPEQVIVATESSSQLIFFNKVAIEEMCLQVSAHASLKLFVGLEDSKINLSKFENQGVWSTWYSFGHRLSMHYLSGALFKAGWVVGSLDMIGSPAGFTRNVTDGVKDFVSLPYNGIWHGPWGFVVGLSQGSSSLVKHVSAGTLTSITNFASSMSRNLDRLSFDTEHVTRNEEVRRLKPQGLGEGLANGLSGVGISLLGAVGGLAHHPIQVLLQEGVSPVRLLGGVGRGVVGVVTKPLGSAAELVAQTGHGMLSGSGWTRPRRPRLTSTPGLVLDLASSSLKYQWKLAALGGGGCGAGAVVAVVEASLLEEEQYIPVTLVLSRDGLHIVSEDEDAVREVLGIQELHFMETSSDPTLLILEVRRPDCREKYEHVSDRVARFVLDSITFAEQGLAPDLQSSVNFADNRKIIFYLSSNRKVEFCTIFKQIKEEHLKYGFPVLF